MPVEVVFKPLPPLNMDETIKWYDHVDADGQLAFRKFIANETKAYLAGIMHSHSATLPSVGEVFCMFAPARWRYKGKSYSVTIITYSHIEVSNQKLFLITRIAVADWRSELLQGIVKGLKELDNTVRWNQINGFIAPEDSMVASLFVNGVEGRSNEIIIPNGVDEKTH